MILQLFLTIVSTRTHKKEKKKTAFKNYMLDFQSHNYQNKQKLRL